MRSRIIQSFFIAAFWPGLATISSAQDTPERLELQTGAAPRVIESSITGEQIIDYVIAGEPSQILSVDLQTTNASNYFNISRADSPEALFIGSTRGTVADIPLPETGEYVVRIYLVRAAARRNESARFSLALGLGAPEFADSLFGGPDFWAVSGLERDALNVRAGPSIRYRVVSKLRNGHVLTNRGCRLTGTERWCNIRASGSGVTGWVAGRYLVEAAAPRVPEVPVGGPVGNGTPFDAAGFVPCATDIGQTARQCAFGVIRAGPGNAGVWIALGNKIERHILFEGGVPVATNATARIEVESQSDPFLVSIGNERYEIAHAIVYGG